MRIILASKSKVRKKILEDNNIPCEVIPSNVDEDQAKESLIAEGANPLLISKNLAELKSIKVSKKNPEKIVLGADSVIDLDNELISKPKSRAEGLKILEKLNGKKHNLISSVCISKNGSMIWHHSDTSNLTMKLLDKTDLEAYLSKIDNEKLFAYGVYQIEANLKALFEDISGDKNSIMGLPVTKIKEYLKNI